jgi:hypothetical protein
MKQRLLPILFLLLFPLLLIASGNTDIIFPHAFHINDMGTECDQCHAGVNSSVSGLDNLLPEMAICTECHDGDTAGDDCGQCHRNINDPQESPRITAFLPKFTHVAHSGEVGCEQCHQGVSASMETSGHYLPTMSLCMDCHDTPLTMQGCDLCHQAQDNLLPDSHAMDWLYMHAAAGKDNCSGCHSDDQCEDCHNGIDGEILFHEVNHLLTHGLDYQMRETECSVCHTENESCQQCHQINAVKPLWHLDNYDGIMITGTHGAEALIDPAYCYLCHSSDSPAVVSCEECH